MNDVKGTNPPKSNNLTSENDLDKESLLAILKR